MSEADAELITHAWQGSPQTKLLRSRDRFYDTWHEHARTFIGEHLL